MSTPQRAAAAYTEVSALQRLHSHSSQDRQGQGQSPDPQQHSQGGGCSTPTASLCCSDGPGTSASPLHPGSGCCSDARRHFVTLRGSFQHQGTGEDGGRDW